MFSIQLFVFILHVWSPDPEFPAPLLAGDAGPPASTAGKPGYSRRVLRVRFHPLQGLKIYSETVK